MEAPTKALPLEDPPTRRKDKDKKNKKKAKDEGGAEQTARMDKQKGKKSKKGKEKKDKALRKNIASNNAKGRVPASSTQRKESSSSTPTTQGSSSEEHMDEKTERSISLPESASEAEAENGSEEEMMGDNTGDEVDLSFDESSENDDDETGEGSGLYHSWSFLGPSRSGSGRIDTRNPSSETLNSRPRSSTRELSEERRLEVEKRALAISSAMGEERIIACQTLWRRALCVSRFRVLVRMNRKRASIVNELIESEKEYVEDLTLAVDMYLKPLRDSLATNEPILPSEMTLRSLFSDMEVIRNYNSALMQQILRRHAQWGPYQKIGDVFVRMNHFLKAYSNYCKHYKEALITLGQLYRNNRFVAFLRRVAEGPSIHGRTLEHFLALPVGRIPAYTDLLDRLARCTWETHPDRPDLSEACDSLRELTAYVQDSRADVQHILTVLHVQNTLLGTDKNIVTLGRRLVREGELEEVSRDGSKSTMWHLILFNDILLWTRPIAPSSSSSSSSSSGSRNGQNTNSLASSSSGGRSPRPSPRRGSWTIFGSSETPLPRSALAVDAVSSSEVRYNVDMIDDLVQLTVSEVPLAYNHPDAEDDYGMYIVRGMTGATPVLLVAHSARERKSWLQDLYSCIDDTVSKHYLRIGKPKKASQPVEERKQVVHRELLGIMQLRKDEYFQYLRHSRSSAVPSNLTKKGKEKKKKPAGSKRAALGRILPMGRRLSDATTAPETTPTRTTQNPLAQVPLRQSIQSGPTNMDPMAASAASTAPSLAGGGVGMGGVGLAGVDTSHHSKLHKSASVTQLDLLMAEMKNDPRAMIHLAPRLERTMQRLNLHDAWDDERLRKKERERELREREREREKEKNSRNGSSSSSKSGFKRSLSLKMRGEKKYEKDRIGAVDKEHRKEKDKDKTQKGGKGKEKEKEKDKGRENNNNEEDEEDGEAEEGDDGSSPAFASQLSAIVPNTHSTEWDLSSSKRPATGSSSPSSSSSSSSSLGSGKAQPRKSSRESATSNERRRPPQSGGSGIKHT